MVFEKSDVVADIERSVMESERKRKLVAVVESRNPRPYVPAWRQKATTAEDVFYQPEVQEADIFPGVVMLVCTDRIGRLTKSLTQAFREVGTSYSEAETQMARVARVIMDDTLGKWKG